MKPTFGKSLVWYCAKYHYKPLSKKVEYLYFKLTLFTMYKCLVKTSDTFGTIYAMLFRHICCANHVSQHIQKMCYKPTYHPPQSHISLTYMTN